MVQRCLASHIGEQHERCLAHLPTPALSQVQNGAWCRVAVGAMQGVGICRPVPGVENWSDPQLSVLALFSRESTFRTVLLVWFVYV